MKVGVFGSGGVGAYFGGRLAQAGEEVAFIARGDHLQAIQSRGLRVTSVAGDFLVRPTRADADPAEIGRVDVVLVGVKAWQVPDAAKAMRPMVGPETFVVPLQNGVDAPDELAAVLGRERVLGGLCRIIAFIEQPGHIKHSGAEPYIAFGELNGTESERVEQLRAAFARATGVSVEVPADIRVAMWNKFLFIAALSGVCAVTRAPIGVVRSLTETRRMLKQALEEIAAVARELGIGLPATAVEETLAFVDGLPPEGTTSMQRDIMGGRPSELASQSGAVVRLAREAGVPVPVHAFIYQSLLPMELEARGETRPRRE
jgi:2-dehydropantoate 2-reductase